MSSSIVVFYPLQANGKVHVERLQRDGGAVLATEEARALVERDAPELLALLDELRDSLQELRSRVGPVLAQVGIFRLSMSYISASHFPIWRCWLRSLLKKLDGALQDLHSSRQWCGWSIPEQ